MRPKPSGAELLDLARRVLRDDVAAELSGPARYKALMAANAMAIVGRQMAAGTEAEVRMLERLTAILGHDGACADLEGELAKALRAGDFGDDRDVHALLLESVEAKLRESNPRALAVEIGG